MALMTEISEGYDVHEVMQVVKDFGTREIHSKPFNPQAVAPQ
jgi:hypothetical protein